MSRFDPRIGAGVAAGLALIYLIGALATGHRARAEEPPDLSPPDAALGLTLWQTLALRVDPSRGARLIDARPNARARLYAIPGAERQPEVDPARLLVLAAEGPVVVVTDADARASALTRRARAQRPGAEVYYLRGGARSWYLRLELPVPLFAGRPAPLGYAASLSTVKLWLSDPGKVSARVITSAIENLARLDYQPTLLKTGAEPP
jgi:hypothetical protein